jgi:multiple sugar transport system ATP-binding protein
MNHTLPPSSLGASAGTDVGRARPRRRVGDVDFEMAAVQIRAVKKTFGKTRILHGVDIDVQDGAFTVLVGPSGCGKSTLLRMIAGLEEITAGEICIGATRVNQLPPKARDVAMVFQNYALYPHMTVRENLAFALMLAREDKAAIENKVRRAAEILGLLDLLERYPRQLSGGQRQRVAMGRAIVRSPRVFLFDEPLSNLDAQLRVAMRSEIKQLHQRLRTTSIYVTHDQIEAMTLGDQIVVMRDGRVEQAGSPLHLYDYPVNLFVAGFIGSPAMNFLPGRLHSSGGGTRLDLDGGPELPLPKPVGVHGQPVMFGVRPEHLRLVASGGIAAEVVVVEPTGADTLVACRHQGRELSLVFRERHAFAPGDTLHLSPEMAQCHVFDTTSGQRLSAAQVT